MRLLVASRHVILRVSLTILRRAPGEGGGVIHSTHCLFSPLTPVNRLLVASRVVSGHVCGSFSMVRNILSSCLKLLIVQSVGARLKNVYRTLGPLRYEERILNRSPTQGCTHLFSPLTPVHRLLVASPCCHLSRAPAYLGIRGEAKNYFSRPPQIFVFALPLISFRI